MRKYSSNLAFVDLLFNLLVGFTCLFIIAFLLINPIAKSGTIDPPVRLIVEASWDDKSSADVDLYVRGPDGAIIYYGNKENGYITLKRDDLGALNDRYVVNGKAVIVERNYEITSMTDLPDGDYVVTVHNFSTNTGPEEVNIRITNLAHFAVAYEGSVVINNREEATVVVFQIRDNQVVSIRTDIEVKLRVTAGRAP